MTRADVLENILKKKIPKPVLLFPDNCVIQYENSYSIVPVLITMCIVTVSFSFIFLNLLNAKY